MEEPKQLDKEKYGIWESWFTPLSRHKDTHYLKIHPPVERGKAMLVKYVSGDFLEYTTEGDDRWVRLEKSWEFDLMKKSLEEGEVEFVRK